jgi:hypothetical protein
MQSKKIFISLLLFNVTALFSQEAGTIQADRPDQTETPYLVPKNKFQIETGIIYEQVNPDYTTLIAPTILYKYGINSLFELRFVTEYVIENQNNTITKGILPLTIGCKIKICEENSFLPKTSILAHVSLPKTFDNEFQSDRWIPSFRLAMQHSVLDKMSLSYNLGVEWNDLYTKEILIYSLTTGYSVTNKIGSYIEMFGGFSSKETENHNLDAGITYLISNYTMIDISAGMQIFTKQPSSCYYSIGFSFRL